MGEADPTVMLIIRGIVVYGIVMLVGASGFQVYRQEKKSALVLGGMAFVLIAMLSAGTALQR